MPRVVARLALVALGLGGLSTVDLPARADETDACIAAAERSQLERRAGKLVAARADLLACSRDACPAVVRRDCARWLGEVDDATPTIVLRSIDAAGDDVTGAHATIDGAPLGHAIDGRAIPLDPGQHEVTFEVGADKGARRVLLREGEHARVVSFTVMRARAPGAARGGFGAGPYIVGGVGAAAVTAGVALWIAGRVDRGDLYDSCAKTPVGCSASRIDAAKAELVAGDVAFGAGLAALAGAAAWAWLSTRRTAAQVTPIPIARGAAVVTFVSF